MRCLPLELRHDGGPTFGFHFSGQADLFGPAWAVGYAADLGSWDGDLAAALSDVDLLALEFNHDVAMQRSSGRRPQLIARVLGDDGHLSNEQAAALFRATLGRSTQRRLRTLVQLHLSRECNRPHLAQRAGSSGIGGSRPCGKNPRGRARLGQPRVCLRRPAIQTRGCGNRAGSSICQSSIVSL